MRLAALNFGLFLDELRNAVREGFFFRSHFFKQLRNQTVVLGYKAVEEMLAVDFLVAVFGGNLLAQLYGFNRFLSKFLNVHAISPQFVVVMVVFDISINNYA